MLPAEATNASFAASDPGFAATSVDDLMEQNVDLIARIKLCYGVDREAFEREILDPVRRYAAYVHLLPATIDNYFSRPGGLLRLGLEVAFFSLQGTDAHIFSGQSTITERRKLEPRWRHATFLAGLCCEVHRTLSHQIVIDARGERWPAYLRPLADWLQTRCTQRYFLRWRPNAQESRGLGLFALPHVVTGEMLQSLAEDSAVIVPQLMASIGGVALYRDRNVLDELVRRSLALVIDRQLTADANRYGSPQFGSHLERYLVDALRRLASGNSAWIPNRDKSRVWLGRDGLFLVWPGAADDVHKLLEADQLPGIPKAPQTLLELLVAAGVFTPQDGSQATWTIFPPGARAPLDAVRLATPAILFAGIDPAPAALSQDLACHPDDADRTPRPPANAGKPGAQLSLIPEDPSQRAPAPSRTPSPPAQPADASPEPPRKSLVAPTRPYALQAPMRLSPAVRDAVAAVLQTLNPDNGPAQCCTIAAGVFIPLAALERRGVLPAQALRGLADASMLALSSAAGPPTITRDFNGTPTAGLVLDPRFIDGVDLDAFCPPEPEGR